MHYLITGANGQLGQEVVNELKKSHASYAAFDSSEMDILDQERIDEVFQKEKPTVVFHCAAYTAVDQAEEKTDLNWAVNVEGTKNIALACKKYDATMVFISTDYVFDGTNPNMYKETDETNPQNEYGKAKREGEKLVQSILKQYYIVRTSWVFGQFGNNFVFTMEKLAKDRPELTIISDQIGRPTWTKTLADFMIHLATEKPAYGLYHLSNEGSCSWFEFAQEILEEKEVNVRPILSEDYPQKAKRPKHSILDLNKAKATGFDIPDWKTALNLFYEQIGR